MRHLTKQFFIVPLLLVLLTGCHVMLIGAYDQVTDESIQSIQNNVSELLVKIDNNLADNQPQANKYEVLKPDFEEIRGEIKSVQIRCDALPKYTIVKRQVQSLGDNVVLLEQFSKTSFTPQTLRIIDSTFGVQFKAIIVLQNGLKRNK